MKKLYFGIYVFCLLTKLQAQNDSLEILLIGTSHSYNAGQDFTNIHKKILTFKPNGIFGEWLSPEDERTATQYWNKENVKKRTQRLTDKRPIAEDKLPSVIADLKKKTVENPKDFHAKVDLAHAYYLNLEAGNAHFQMWQVAKELKRDSSQRNLFEYAKLVLAPNLQSIKSVINAFSNSEYDLIAYPMLMQLGLTDMHPMDYQAFDPFWNEAWAFSDSLENLFVQNVMRDSMSPEAMQYRTILKIEKAFEDDQRALSETKFDEKHITEILNTPYMDDYSYRMNIVSPEKLTLRGFPAAPFQDKWHWYQMRNRKMAENTINRSKAKGFKRAVIIVGSGHRYGLYMQLAQIPRIKVWNINDYEVQ